MDVSNPTKLATQRLAVKAVLFMTTTRYQNGVDEAASKTPNFTMLCQQTKQHAQSVAVGHSQQAMQAIWDRAVKGLH